MRFGIMGGGWWGNVKEGNCWIGDIMMMGIVLCYRG